MNKEKPMPGIAAIAAKEAAVAAGMSLLRGVGPSVIVGFTAGIVISGSCLALVARPRHGRRHRSAARMGHLAEQPGISPLDAAAEMVVPAGVARSLVEFGLPVAPPTAPLHLAVPAQRSDRAKLAGQDSRHRSTDPSAADWRTAIKRSTARHAAPSAGIGRRVVSALPLLPLAVRH